MAQWWVYVLLGDVGGRSLSYVGCTTDVDRRLRQHNGELAGGAKFTRTTQDWTVAKVYGPYSGRSEAQSVEYRVKKLRGLNRTRWEP